MYSTRSKSKDKKLQESLKDSKTGHFGKDVSTTVSKAMDQGGSLDSDTRKKMKGDIARQKLYGASLEKIFSPDLATHIGKHRLSGDTVSQVDKRIKPRDGGKYEGFMLSSTRVSASTFDPSLKEIGEPLSPNPYSGSGMYHRAHTTPFNLGGIETNKTRTVNALSWANITVDSFIEDKAKRAAGKYGEGSTFHFRIDTHDHSTVGYVVERPGKMDEDKRWKAVAAQYLRK